jgi:3-deoxy-D-manno-octulosonic-acid transferase
MYFLYSAALALALVLASPWVLAAAKRRAGLREKLGRVPVRLRPTAAGESCIWVHAVSVGEVLAASRLISTLAKENGCRVVISTTTVTGQRLARERFGEAFYFPLDFAFAIRPYLRILRPELLVLVESEFWPNFLRLARASGAGVAVINARISDRSLPRYLALKFFWQRILRGVDVFLARSGQDRDRLLSVGAEPARIRVTGNLKFDITAPPDLPMVHEFRRRTEGTPVIVAGSTAEGEDTIILQAFGRVLQQHPRTLLILAPRHPERFDAVAALVAGRGIRLWRRSQLSAEQEIAGGVLLLDTIGELSAIYALASIAFVGGSLVPRGGHNILEPAQHGVAVLTGPHTENFHDIVEIFQREDAVRVVDTGSLATELLRLLGDDREREELGRRAAAVFRSQAGATQRTLEQLLKLLPSSSARRDIRPLEVGR